MTSDSNSLAQPPELTMPYLMQEMDGLQLWWVRTIKYKVAKSLRRIVSWLHFEWRLFLMPKADLPRPDAIIVSSLSLLTILNGFLLRRRYGCRLVFEIRDIWPLTIVEEGGFSPNNPFVRLLGLVEKLGYRYADAIVGTMPNLGEHVSEVLGKPRETFCVPMGVDMAALSQSEPLPADYLAEFIPTSGFVVAHVGSIGITNALDTFLDCALAMKDDADIHFLVVGEGDLRSHYIATYGHLPNVTFAPRVPKSAVQTVLKHCDLHYFAVHQSAVWRFGQSLNKIIDYMVSGKPVIASYTGFPSMINEAECGVYVPVRDVDALRREIKRFSEMDVGEREAIGARGRQWILENRRYEKLAQDYLAILSPKVIDIHRQEKNHETLF